MGVGPDHESARSACGSEVRGTPPPHSLSVRKVSNREGNLPHCQGCLIAFEWIATGRLSNCQWGYLILVSLISNYIGTERLPNSQRVFNYQWDI